MKYTVIRENNSVQQTECFPAYRYCVKSKIKNKKSV